MGNAERYKDKRRKKERKREPSVCVKTKAYRNKREGERNREVKKRHIE